MGGATRLLRASNGGMVRDQPGPSGRRGVRRGDRRASGRWRPVGTRSPVAASTGAAGTFVDRAQLLGVPAAVLAAVQPADAPHLFARQIIGQPAVRGDEPPLVIDLAR